MSNRTARAGIAVDPGAMGRAFEDFHRMVRNIGLRKQAKRGEQIQIEGAMIRPPWYTMITETPRRGASTRKDAR